MSQVGFLLFFVVMSTLLGLINWHALNWLARAFGFSERVRRAVWWVFVASLAGMMLGRVIGWAWSDAPVRLLLGVSGTIQLAILMSVGLLLPVDVARLVGALVRRVRGVTAPAPAAAAEVVRAEVADQAGDALAAPVEAPREPVILRRTLLVQAAVGSAFLIGGSSSVYGALVGRHDYEIDEVPVRIPGLARALDGFTIVQLSDVHIGSFVGTGELRAGEEFVRRAKPDLIVLTGDLLDNDAALAPRLGEFVRRLQPLARMGVSVISGNHDFYAGIAPFVAAVRGGGGNLLQNRGQVVSSGDAAFALLGVDDVWARRRGGGPDLARALDSLGEHQGSKAKALDLPRILLCHNPSYFEDAAGQVALQLSGHTHGGQVSLIVNPAEWFVKRGWVRGSYEYKGSQLYVNRGFGTVGPPARVNSPPEITRIVLTA
jgi:predicted MPP superfamily phosphohydrolase